MLQLTEEVETVLEPSTSPTAAAAETTTRRVRRASVKSQWTVETSPVFAARAATDLLIDSALTHSRAFAVDWTRLCSRVAAVQRMAAAGGMRMLSRVQVPAAIAAQPLTKALILTRYSLFKSSRSSMFANANPNSNPTLTRSAGGAARPLRGAGGDIRVLGRGRRGGEPRGDGRGRVP